MEAQNLITCARRLAMCACMIWLSSMGSADPLDPTNGATTIALWPKDLAIARPEVTGPESRSRSTNYFLALREAKVPAEMHLYAHGGHAFGLRPTEQPITHWPDLMEKWLHTIGILKD
jgi:acetyl esterase/lipase